MESIKVKQDSAENKENVRLTLDAVMCPICLDILCMPVTMGCKHEMCKECYDNHFKKANFYCPMCKMRLSTWARKAACQGSIVNLKKWNQIQAQYPDLLQKRHTGKGNDVFLNCGKPENLAAPGEVNKEYIQTIEKFRKEQEETQKKEEEASLRLIQEIQKQDELELQKQRNVQKEKDLKLARTLSKQLNMEISPSRVNRIILRKRSAKDRNNNTTKVKFKK